MASFQGKLKIRHLEVVLAVADCGNLSRAATQLGLTQSGLARARTDAFPAWLPASFFLATRFTAGICP